MSKRELISLQVIRVGEMYAGGKDYQLSFGARNQSDRKPFRFIADPMYFPDAAFTRVGDYLVIEYSISRSILWPFRKFQNLTRLQNLSFENEATATAESLAKTAALEQSS